MGVSFPTSRNPLCDAFNASMASLGFKEIDDFNVPDPNGYGYRQGTIWKGWRVSTASAYLEPALKRRNLEVLSLTRVRRVLLDGKRAVGVETQAEGAIKRLRARKEVIVCAGTFHSPHLLLHSGIGDERDLQSWGVTPLHHLRAVGRHLRDHPAAPIAMETSDSTSYGHSWKALPRNVAQSVRYLATRRGQYASNLFETTAYIRTLPESDRPDLQIVFQPARRNPKPFPIPLGHGYAIVSVCIYPQSTGRVSLSGPDPFAEPLIDPALGSDEADLRTILRGLKMARAIFAHEAFAKYRAHEVFPGPEVASDEQWLEHIRNTLTTVHHPGSTCRMGQAGDNVVDHELKVHGLEHLRVADASIYPRLVGANTNASVVAIAEKASDMILGKPAPAPMAPTA
jgi:choline dehydrogenase-like flavoprotein